MSPLKFPKLRTRNSLKAGTERATEKTTEKSYLRLSLDLENLAKQHVGKYLKKEFLKSTKHLGRLEFTTKSDDSLVTKIDVESERQALRYLKKRYPSFGFVSEETAPDRYESLKNQDFFVIDPLDGTTNFVRGFPMFCFTVAAVIQGEIVAAATYHPILELSFRASLRGGSFLNGKRIQVSSVENFKEAVLTTGFAYTKETNLKQEMEAFAKVSKIARAVRRPGSAALDLAYTALGVFDGFWEQNLKPWDTAAGALLVTEAGGIVSDFSGKAYELDSPSLLATNPMLQKKFLSAVGSQRNP